MSLFFAGIFIAASIVNLYACIKERLTIRAVAKAFLLSSLLGWYISSSSSSMLLIIAAVILSWLGDIFLIHDGVNTLMIGGGAFMCALILYSISFMLDTEIANISPVLMVIIPIIYIAAVFFIYSKLKEYMPQEIRLSIFLYLLINSGMNCFAWFRFLSIPCVLTAVAACGAVLFLISDAILFSVTFNKSSRWKTHFPVMLTYILAQACIVFAARFLH